MAEVALSTMWGVGRFAEFGDFFREALAVGFDRFELNHAVDSEMLRGIELENGYRVASVHEPCPADVSTGTLKDRNWLVSSPDETERREGVRAVKASIDLAHRFGASTVIVHPGRVDLDFKLEARFYQMFRESKSSRPEFTEVKDKLITARQAQAEINMRSVRKSLRELAEYAAELKVRLGLENRFHYHEIPLPDELQDLLSPNYDNVGYWHDVGHAQVLANLGLGTHAEWLERFSHRIVGVHLHDVIGIEDHRVAGTGQMDWEMVARYIPAGALRTCEFQNNNTPQQVKAGVKFLIEKGIVRA